MSTLERLEEWMNGEYENDTAVQTSRTAAADGTKDNTIFDPSIFSDARLYLHKVKIRCTGSSDLELLIEYEQVSSNISYPKKV